MSFLRTKSGDLIALIDIARLYEMEHAAGGRAVVAVMRGTGVQVELARDLNIQVLARVPRSDARRAMTAAPLIESLGRALAPAGMSR